MLRSQLFRRALIVALSTVCLAFKSHALEQFDEGYDYVIVGAGSAGSVIANRLTEDSDITVLLLEAGGKDVKPEIHMPPKWLTLQNTEVDWADLTEKEAFLNNRRVPLAHGKVLGGSSSINAMAYIRGNRLDYDRWEAAGNECWGYKHMLHYFRKSENRQRGSSKFHGANGLLSVTDPSAPTEASKAFVRAAMDLGLEENPDFNGEKQEGTGLYQRTIEGNNRESTSTAFLRPAMSRPNLKISTESVVSRILFRGRRAVGVAYEQGGVKKRVTAKIEVIISAGSYDSPKILMLSGIGPKKHLNSLGIPVVRNLQGVGRNLQDHPVIVAVYQSLQNITAAQDSNLAEAGAFLHTEGRRGRDSIPNLQLAFLLSNTGAKIFTVGAFNNHPESRGRVMLKSSSPKDRPKIQANYLSIRHDADVLVKAVKIMRKIIQSKELDALRGPELVPGVNVTTDEDIRSFVYATVSTGYHPTSTCRMGNTWDPMAVVDSQLQVIGVRRLRVVDASVMPTIVAGNTNAPTIAIAEKASDLIKISRLRKRACSWLLKQKGSLKTHGVRKVEECLRPFGRYYHCYP